MASLEQYLALLINLAMLTVLARLLSPGEIGFAVVAMGLVTVVFSLREFATPEFLIQQPEIGPHDIRTSFTVFFVITVALAVALLIAAHPLAHFYRAHDLYKGHELASFLQIAVVAALVEVVSLPISALLRRNMAFGALARIRTAGSGVMASVTIMLAWFGFSYMSYAWGMLAGAIAVACLSYAVRPAEWSFRPSVASWRQVLAFGRYKGATTAIERINEAVPQLFLGRVMPMAAVGIYNRANAVCGIPDRMLLSSIFAVAFPALAAEVRAGRCVKNPYLKTLSYITVVYWPALILIAITADDLVALILGQNWMEAVPIVRILALAAVFWFPVVPTNPLLLALGKNRDAFLASLVARSLAAMILCTASLFGLVAMAASQFIAIPLQMLIALYFARRHIVFSNYDLAAAIMPSALVTLFALAGPMSVIAMNEGQLVFSLPQLTLIGFLAGLGWLAGLVAVRHPFLTEITPLLQPAAARVEALRNQPAARSVLRFSAKLKAR